ncbi:hypothetical protein PR048_030507 [Dryococelus australis]|uniref:HIT-type domain-containing protein n=1 Tax=Dryococelus australis TaxID=614101 RepID=A0ABQ9GD18_9NEOP|nr:hypothetical protein PR048_030507 [Dryococelus australis]
MPQKYVCPRCNAPYCSVLCYKSPIHSNCSEAFYRECVVEEIKNSPVNPNKTQEILERTYKTSQQDFDINFMDDSFSSGDEEASSDIDDAPFVSENTVKTDAVSG